MDLPSDRDLAVRARRGEAEAYGELVERYQTSVYNVCYRMMDNRQEAEDMSQEVFLRGYDRLATFDPERPFGPWIRRVAANYCLNRLAVKRPVTLPLEDEHETSRGTPARGVEQAAEAADRAHEIRRAIMRLTPEYRAVIELRHFQELSYNEIAHALGLSLPQVKSNLFRARKLLAEILKSHE
jgi:RNA polymerase sigma-70 factor (ECF subfamily)